MNAYNGFYACMEMAFGVPASTRLTCFVSDGQSGKIRVALLLQANGEENSVYISIFLADRNLPIYSTSEFSSFVVFRRVNLLICDNT